MPFCSKSCHKTCLKSKLRPPPPIVETVKDESVSKEPPSLCACLPPSGDDGSILDLNASDDVFGINSIDVHLSGLPLTNDGVMGNNLVNDPSLDINDLEFTHFPQCCCSNPTSLID